MFVIEAFTSLLLSGVNLICKGVDLLLISMLNAAIQSATSARYANMELLMLILLRLQIADDD